MFGVLEGKFLTIDVSAESEEYQEKRTHIIQIPCVEMHPWSVDLDRVKVVFHPSSVARMYCHVSICGIEVSI